MDFYKISSPWNRGVIIFLPYYLIYLDPFVFLKLDSIGTNTFYNIENISDFGRRTRRQADSPT